jgi:hypothetical protein
MSRLHYATASVVATTILGACMAQTPVTFNSKSFAGGNRPANLYTYDLNNDGLHDILQDAVETGGVSVILGSKPGNFRLPAYSNPPTCLATGNYPMAIADWDRDGILTSSVP